MYIAYSCTRTWYDRLFPAIASLLEHNKPTKIFILAEDDKLPFDIPCKHQVINVSGQQYFRKDGPNVNYFATYMAMIRICMPELVKVNKVIFLDVDTIVCDSLKPIWDIDLTGKWAAMVKEYKGQWKPYGPDYWNCGVSVMNLQQMRKDNATKILVDDINSIRFYLPEQDALNMEAGGTKIADLPLRYNECFCTGYTDNPAVVHYAGIQNWVDNHNMFRWEYLDQYTNDAW